MMKKALERIAIVILLCIAASNAVVSAEQGEYEAYLTAFSVAAENEHLILYLNPDNTEIAVEDKRTGSIWFSNPPNRRAKEKIARGQALNKLSAQFSISYYTPGDNLRHMDNYNDSVVYEQYEILPIDNGVRIEYVVGRQWSDQSFLPVMIRRESFEELILDRLEKRSDRGLFEDCYELVTLVKIPDDYERVSVYRIDKEAVFGDYTLVSPGRKLNERDKVALIETVADQIVNNRPDLAGREALTFEHFQPFVDKEVYVLKSKLRAWDIEDMIELIKTVDYTPEDVAEDHRAMGIAEPTPEYRTFTIVIEYTLDGENLVVRVPLDEIVYPENVLDEEGNRVTLPLYTINVLEFFGAADSDATGYIFVPDGSGALINFNNGKSNFQPYYKQIYGQDLALTARKDRTTFTQQVYFPVFGLKHEYGSLVAIVEDGEAITRIRGDVAGRTTSYNVAYPEILVVPMARAELQGTVNVVVEGQIFRNQINVYQKRKNSGDVVIRYAFLPRESADYVGMALYYQKYLEERGALTKLPSQDNVPFFLELVGAVNVKEPVVGVPVNVIKRLTDYSQAEAILDELRSAGVDGIKLRFSGWLKGGLQHVYPVKLKPEGKVGSREKLASFAAYASDIGAELFLDVNFLNAYKHNLWDAFIPFRDASRYLNRQIARVYPYDLATYRPIPENSGYVVSPREMPGLVDSFLTQFQKLDVDGISLRLMGTQVNSDYREREERLVDRQQAREILRQQLAKAVADGLTVLVDGVNAFALPYVENLVNVPTESSRFHILDQDVPFLQIVLHGYKNYAGEPVNLAQNVEDSLLKAVETGACPYYLLTYEDSSILKDSSFNFLYSTNFRYWLSHAVDGYVRINEELKDVYHQRIVGHQQLAESVYVTVYENGHEVYVNYGQDSVEIGPGLTVPPKDFLVVRRGEADGQ